MTSLEGKVFAITGAASGIGLATAHLLAARGASLSIADIQSDALSAAAESIQTATPSAKLHHQTVNVADSGSVNEWHDAIIKHYGQLDGAANLAGIIGTWKRIEETEDDDFDRVISVNLKGVFNCVRAQLQRIKGNGSIVNAASVAGMDGAATPAPYCASKHGVIGLTKSAAKEVGGRGLRVNCIAPGPIKTPMTANVDFNNPKLIEKVPLGGRPGQPQEVAKLISFLLSDESSYTSGSVYVIDGAWSA